MTGKVEPIVTFATKQDWVAEIVRERIIVGTYARGQQLKQADLAEQLGVSITPVREALLTLEAEGYVRGLPHKGLLVPELDGELTAEIYRLRVMLERELTAAALRNLDAPALAALRAQQAVLAAALDAGDIRAVRVANYRFHFQLYERARQPQTLKFVRVLWAKYPFTSQDADPGRPRRMREEHETFLRHAEAADQEGAVAAMLRHIENGWIQAGASA